MVGLLYVNFLMVKSSALLLAKRRLFKEDRSASFVFCKCSMVLSISSTSDQFINRSFFAFLS